MDTGIISFATFRGSLAHAVIAGRHGAAFSLLSVGLGAGEIHELEQLAAQRIAARVRSTDAVCRLSPYEFLVLLTGGTHREGAGVCAAKIVAALSAPYVLGSRELRVPASVGIALYPCDAATGSTLLQCARTAMMEARQRAHHGAQYWRPLSSRRAQVKAALH